MTKPKTPYNDLAMWRHYCERLGKLPFPKTIADFLKITVPDQHARISKNRDQAAGPTPSLPYNGDRCAETRVPIARSITAIRAFKRVKTDKAKRRHLGVALAWLECPHPWQGEGTKVGITALITDIKRAVDDPSTSLDHILDRSFSFDHSKL